MLAVIFSEKSGSSVRSIIHDGEKFYIHFCPVMIIFLIFPPVNVPGKISAVFLSESITGNSLLNIVEYRVKELVIQNI